MTARLACARASGIPTAPAKAQATISRVSIAPPMIQSLSFRPERRLQCGQEISHRPLFLLRPDQQPASDYDQHDAEHLAPARGLLEEEARDRLREQDLHQ